MKPAAFEYTAPTSVEEALDVIGSAPEDSMLLAGGQSLMPLLNMRLAQPRLIVDLNRVTELAQIEPTAGGGHRFGAMVRQRRLETDPRVRECQPLLAEAARHVAHVSIRTRGTLGGSLAHADPAAELPAVVAALDGRMLIRGRGGLRSVAAGNFFLGPRRCAVGPGELLAAVELDPPPAGTGWAFLEVARTRRGIPLVAAAAWLRVDRDGRVDVARLALAGVGGVPYVAHWLEHTALGERVGEALFREIGMRVRKSVAPGDDIHASASYRRHVADVLAVRALSQAAGRSEATG